MMNNVPKDLMSVQDLLLAIREGDQDAFVTLLLRYRPLIDRAVDRFSAELYSEESREDLRQEALAAFYDAVRSYRIDQENVEFGLYAKVCIGNRVISHMRREQRQLELVSLDEATAERVLGADGDLLSMIIEEEECKVLSQMIEKTLSAYENEVLSYYLRGYSAAGIADALHKSVKSIDNAIARIRKKLKNLLQDRL
ncbi:MAG: sigma-70 family RNA polymerase sigma factor [Clostridia bacterium]|nr:sigma-70 family RNA polymerase sigma factor [Clostridia bacterium]